MIDESGIENAEINLLRFYRDTIEKPEGYLITDIYHVLKGMCKKGELKEARKRLRIQSYQKDAAWYWAWKNDKSPAEILRDKGVLS